MKVFVDFKENKFRKQYQRDNATHHSWHRQKYRVLHFESFSESSKGYVVLVNDDGEIWWVENRHVRVLNEEDVNQ